METRFTPNARQDYEDALGKSAFLLHASNKYLQKRYSARGKESALLTWDGIPDNLANVIRDLRIDDDKSEYSTLPDSVLRLPNLKTLRIPFHLVDELLSADSLKIKQLHVLARKGGEQKVMRLPDRLHLPTVEVLDTMGSGTQKCSFSASSFPSLTYLSLCLSPSQTMLKTVYQYDHLDVLILGGLRDSKSLYKLAGVNPKSLGLFRGSLNLDGIDSVTTIDELWLRELNQVEDLTPLLGLPQLKKLLIWHMKKIKNPDVLLELKSLKYLKVVGCSPEFAKSTAIETLKERDDCEVEVR